MLFFFFQIYAIPYVCKNIAIVQIEESILKYYFCLVNKSIYNTTRLGMLNNWHTSLILLERMFKDLYNIKITDTVKKNKRKNLKLF